MLTQWLEIKARGCCRHVFLVSFIVQRLGLFSARSPRSLPLSTAREERKGGAPNQTRWKTGVEGQKAYARNHNHGRQRRVRCTAQPSSYQSSKYAPRATRGKTRAHASVARSLIIIHLIIIHLISIHYFNTWPVQVADSHIIRQQKFYSLPKR